MAVVCFGEELVVPTACVSFVLFLVSILNPTLRKKKTVPVAMITAVLSALWILTFLLTNVYPVWESYSGVQAQVVAVQKCPGYTDGEYYYNEFKTKSINGEDIATGFTLVTSTPIFTKPYDEITLNCALEKNEYEPSLAKGNYLISWIYGEPKFDKTSPDKKPIMAYIYELNSKIEDALYDELSMQTADFSSALLLGNKYALSYEVKDLFRTCGISHIVVVSGLHLSIITSVAAYILRRFTSNKYVFAGILCFTVIGFGALTGFGFSVRRAMIMQLVLILSSMFRRRADALNSLGLAALIILISNPLAIADVGLQLSFLSTLGIILWCSKLSDLIIKKAEKLKFFTLCLVNKLLRLIVVIFCTTLCATVFTLPVTVLTFNRVSGVSLITNMVVAPFMNVVLVLVALCGIFHFILFMPFLSDICAFFIERFYSVLISFCESISKLPFAYINTEDSYFLYWIVFTVVLSLIGAILTKKLGEKAPKKFVIPTVAALSAIFLIISSVAYNNIHKHDVDVTVYNTKSSFYAVLESEEGHCVLSAYGSKSAERRLIDDLEFANTTDEDILINNGGINADGIMISLLSSFDYGEVLLYDSGNDRKEHEEVLLIYPQTEVFTNAQSVDLWGLGTVDIIPDKKYSFEYIDMYGSSILIVHRYADISNIPKRYGYADTVISPDIPKNAELLSCRRLVLPEIIGEDEAAVNTANEIAEEVLFRNDYKFTVKR